MALIPDLSESTVRDWLNELKAAGSLIIIIIRESADFYITLPAETEKHVGKYFSLRQISLRKKY